LMFQPGYARLAQLLGVSIFLALKQGFFFRLLQFAEAAHHANHAYCQHSGLSLQVLNVVRCRVVPDDLLLIRQGVADDGLVFTRFQGVLRSFGRSGGFAAVQTALLLAFHRRLLAWVAAPRLRSANFPYLAHTSTPLSCFPYA